MSLPNGGLSFCMCSNFAQNPILCRHCFRPCAGFIVQLYEKYQKCNIWTHTTKWKPCLQYNATAIMCESAHQLPPSWTQTLTKPQWTLLRITKKAGIHGAWVVVDLPEQIANMILHVLATEAKCPKHTTLCPTRPSNKQYIKIIHHCNIIV